MELNVDDIDLDELELTHRGYVMSILMKNGIYDNFELSDELFSWVVNPPPIYAAAGDGLKERIKKHAEEYEEKKPESLRLTRLIKAEFYKIMCTDSESYKKERSLFGEHVHVLIAGLASAIAVKISESNIAIITSFITCFILASGKMGKNVICEYCKPTEVEN